MIVTGKRKHLDTLKAWVYTSVRNRPFDIVFELQAAYS